MLHGLIMAGGAGTRFWPLSRKTRPKQMLALAGNDSLLRQTVRRFQGIIPPERLLVMTNEALVAAIRVDLPELPPQGIIGEPAKRDTAPCIGLAAALLARRDAEAIMVVSPADHVIRATSAFHQAIECAVQLVDEMPERLVTFGIAPTYPAETFGYIERGEPIGEGKAGTAFHVARFREKPDRATAQSFVDSGRFYWNSGIFVWRAATLLEQLARFEPEMAAAVQQIAAAWEEGPPAVFPREFARIERKSIDYAVMERAANVVMVEAPFDWDDVGSWQALARLEGSDSRGNTLRGRVLPIGTSGTIVYTNENHLVATLGVEDLIIVHTPDATLVARRDDEESIRRIVATLNEQKWTEYL